MMKMSFYLGYKLSDLLFKGWNTATVAEFIGTCVLLMVLAFIAEILTLLSIYINQEANFTPVPQLRVAPETESEHQHHEPSMQSLLIPPSLEYMRKRKLYCHILQTITRVVHLVIGYFLMLAVMTYNGWIGIAIVLGYGLGYFVIGAVRVVLIANKLPELTPRERHVHGNQDGPGDVDLPEVT